jgi:hypothetical protein
MDRPSQTDPIWRIKIDQKGPLPVTRLSGKVDWINASPTSEPDGSGLAPEDERRIAEVTLGGRSELRGELETAFGGPAWPQAGAVVEPFRRYAITVFDVNAAAYRNSASAQGGESNEVLRAMASNLLVEVFGREWEHSPGEEVIRTDWQHGTEGWKGKEIVVIAGNDPDPTCLYHELIGDAIKYRYRFHAILPDPVPGDPPGLNLSNAEWWQYVGLKERHNLAMAIKPYLDDRVEYWLQQFTHEQSVPAKSANESRAEKRQESRQSERPKSGTIDALTGTIARAPSLSDSIAMESPTRIKFEAGLALAEVTLAEDLKDLGPSLEVAQKYVVNATLALARCILTPSCLEPYEAIQRAYDFAEYFAADAMKTAWIWICVFSEMNASGKLKKYKHDEKPVDGGPKGISDSEMREWHGCLFGAAHEALDEFVPEFWKERLKYLSDIAAGAAPPESETPRATVGNQDSGTPAQEASDSGIEPNVPRQHDANRQAGKSRKGDAALLGEKRLVSFGTAEQYLGISERQRQKLINSGALKVEGQGHNRKITVESLRAYLPPEFPN